MVVDLCVLGEKCGVMMYVRCANTCAARGASDRLSLCEGLGERSSRRKFLLSRPLWGAPGKRSPPPLSCNRHSTTTNHSRRNGGRQKLEIGQVASPHCLPWLCTLPATRRGATPKAQIAGRLP